jgi:NAD(P)H dehydrogenase (quinone)
MKISAILAHPHPESFNHAISQTSVQALLQNGHQIAFHDLYQESFDSILCLEEIAKDASLGDTIRIHWPGAGKGRRLNARCRQNGDILIDGSLE